MYNEEIKTEYLSSVAETIQKTHNSYFNTISPYEKELRKDICFFSQKEFQSMMQNIYRQGSTEKNLYNIIVCLNRYLKWCKEHYSIDSRTSFEIDYSKLVPFYYKSTEEMISKVIITMQSKSKEDFPVVEVMNHREAILMNYNIAIGAILLSWYGLNFEEMMGIENDDILDSEDGIYVKSRKTIIYVEPPIMYRLKNIKYGKNYLESVRDSDSGENIILEKKFAFTPYFFKKRNPKSNIVSAKTLSAAISDFNQNSVGTKFSSTFLKENGNFCRAYERAKKLSDLAPKNKSDNEYYNLIFDDWTKELTPQKFSALKYRYRKFLAFLESEE